MFNPYWILDHLDELIFLIDQDGKIVFCNQQVRQILGFNPGELTGRIISEITETDLNKFLPSTQKRIIQFISNDEQLVSLECSVHTKSNSENNLVMLKCNIGAIGILERSHREEALRTGILSAIPDLLMIVDRDGNFNYIHAPDQEELVMEPQELIGKNLSEFLKPDMASIILGRIREALDSGKTMVEEYSMEGKRGLQYFEARISGAGEFGAVVLIRNITDEKIQEARIVDSEKIMRSVIDQSIDGILIINEAGKLIEWNQGAVDQTGLEKEEVLGKIFVDILRKIQKSPSEQLIAKVLYHFRDPKDANLKFVDDVKIIDQKEKTEKFLQFIAFPIQIGEELHVCAIARDLTDEKLYQQKIEEQNLELQELNSTKDKFFSIIAHDLRTPFNQLKGLTEILYSQYQKNDTTENEQLLNLVRQSINQGSDLLYNLLEWSRSQTGRIKFNPDNLRLKSITEKVTNLLEHSMNKKEIELKQNISEQLIVHADQNMLETVFRNLIGNAIKFTPRGGYIIIDALTDGKYATIEIKDSGRGMSLEEQKKLFRIDMNYSAMGTENEKGSGLGLILSKDFVEKHGGRIWAESNPRIGSSFFFTLPLSR